jgi:hypothetical protein
MNEHFMFPDLNNIPEFQRLFGERVETLQLAPDELDSIRQCIQFQFMQSQRPMKRSDVLSHAFNATSLLELLHDRLRAAAYVDWLANQGGAERADSSADNADRGGPR